MGKLFKEDEFLEVYGHFIQFECYKKTKDVKMEDFITEFEKLYNCIRQKNMILQPALIALKLLDALQCDSNNWKLVLTAVDYNKVNMLFDQMKNALWKFHWQQAILASSVPIKIATALEATPEIVYYSNNQHSNYQQSQLNNFSRAPTTKRNFELSPCSLENFWKR